jgi:hypothetical protein
MSPEPAIYGLMPAIWGPVAGKGGKPARESEGTKLKLIRLKEAATVLWYAQPAAKWAAALAGRQRPAGYAGWPPSMPTSSPRNLVRTLFSLCFPAPQAEGTFGATAASAERLLPSQSGERNRLPAVLQAGVEGTVNGLRARGGFEVDMTWRAGKLTEAVVRSQAGQPGHLRWQDRICEVKMAVRESFNWTD